MTKTDWEDWKSENYGDLSALKGFCYDNNISVMDDVLVGDEDITDYLREQLDISWARILYALQNVDRHTYEALEIDGYGNLQPPSSWDSYADEVEEELVFDED